jgi:hypothetical protein
LTREVRIPFRFEVSREYKERVVDLSSERERGKNKC